MCVWRSTTKPMNWNRYRYDIGSVITSVLLYFYLKIIHLQYLPALLKKFPFYHLHLLGEKPHDVRFKMFLFFLYFLTVDVWMMFPLTWVQCVWKFRHTNVSEAYKPFIFCPLARPHLLLLELSTFYISCPVSWSTWNSEIVSTCHKLTTSTCPFSTFITCFLNLKKKTLHC